MGSLVIPRYKFKDQQPKHSWSRDDWLHLMVEIGYWAYTNADNNELGKNTYITLLVPTRQCCSQFILFGSILASLSDCNKNLSWQEILDLDEDTEVYCDEKIGGSSKFKAYAGKRITMNGDEGREFKRLGKSKRKKEEKFTFFENYYHQRKLSLVQPPTRGYIGTFNSTLKYYQNLLKDAELSLDNSKCDNLLITNKTQWNHRSKSIFSDNGNSMLDLLFSAPQTNDRFSKINIKSDEAYNYTIQREELKDDQSKLAILDGYKAVLKHIEYVINPKNIVLLLEYEEYDELCKSEIERIVKFECDDGDLFLDLRNFKTDMGIQIMAFNYKE